MRSLVLMLLLVLSVVSSASDITIRMLPGPGYGIPPKEAIDPRSQARRAMFEAFQRENPGITVMNAGGLELVGAQADSLFLMSMIGDNTPDVFYVNFRQYYQFIDQGFCRPLDDFIAKDPSVLDRTSPIIRDVLTSKDGKIYAVPFFHVALGLNFRRDFYIEAGLDPAKPPKTWEEFIQYGRRLVESAPNRPAFIFSNPPGYLWSNFVYQAGGDIVRTKDGKTSSAINTPAAAEAVQMFRRLLLETWKGKDGKTYGPVAKISTDFGGDIRQGKTAMWFSYTNDVQLASAVDIPMQLIAVAAMPAGPGGSSNEINAGMWAINSSIKDPKKLAACWKFIEFFAGERAARVNTEKLVELGLGNQVNPTYLEKFGFPDLAEQVDPSYVQASKDIFKNGHPEPYGHNVQQVYTVLDDLLDRARVYPNQSATELLAITEREMNKKLLGYRPEAEMQKLRGYAAGILISFAVIGGLVTFFVLRRRALKPKEDQFFGLPKRPRALAFMVLCLLPAALSLLIWSYYPLGKGLTIAFQDYKVVKGAEWVGTDNFINVFSSPIFYQSLWNSFVYVGLTIAIGFFVPILLALALNEIPRFKVLFRTIFYLPAMTSPIVISLLWRQFYDKSPEGLLNTILAPVIALINPVLGFLHIAPLAPTHDWLGDPGLAMLAVVIPGIWAGAGPGSILYLAALKNIPGERYEAADLDGANWVQKIRFITLPGLKPLILINLLGVFIAGFKAMESIFVLTFGGPLNATHTIGLEVWKNAFMFLKFGYATAAAWVMGAILIGFTILQIRSLLKMRFTTAKV